MKRGIYIIIMGGGMLFSACESYIDIDLPQPESMLVVDGVIESGEAPRITVSKSVPYFDEINLGDLNALAELFVTDATVILTDGITTDTCYFTVNPNVFPPVFYTTNNLALKGQPGKKYQLTIYANDDTLTGSTTIPGIVALDDLYWQVDGDKDSLGYGWGILSDPDTVGNNYHLFAKRQGYQYYASAGTSDDRIFNGQTTNFSFPRPRPLPSYLSQQAPEEDKAERRYFKRGDTISVKFCSMDLEAYNFIRTYKQAAASFGNPFSAPTFVKSNIQGGFGGFVGYGVSHHTFVVPQ